MNGNFSFARFEKPVAINLYRYANAKLAGMTTSFTEAEHHLAKIMAAAKPLVTAEAEAERKRRAQEEERRRQAAQAKKQADEVAMNEAKYGALHIGEEVYTCHRHGGIMQPRYFTTCSHIVIEIIGSRYRIESLRTCQGFYPGQRTLITRGEAAKRASLLTRKDGWGRRYLVCDPKIFQ